MQVKEHDNPDPFSYDNVKSVEAWVTEREIHADNVGRSDWMTVEPPLGPQVDDIEALGEEHDNPDPFSYDNVKSVEAWVTEREIHADNVGRSDWMTVEPPLGPQVDDIEALGEGVQLKPGQEMKNVVRKLIKELRLPVAQYGSKGDVFSTGQNGSVADFMKDTLISTPIMFKLNSKYHSKDAETIRTVPATSQAKVSHASLSIVVLRGILGWDYANAKRMIGGLFCNYYFKLHIQRVDIQVIRKFKGVTLMPSIRCHSDKKTHHYLPNRCASVNLIIPHCISFSKILKVCSWRDRFIICTCLYGPLLALIKSFRDSGPKAVKSPTPEPQEMLLTTFHGSTEFNDMEKFEIGVD
ncbi:armadillo-type fold protein [Artemisia annua]|uniref:Armadillo-type fold protein n=1 Tax=Artemisia annua TaxID=35608 RepID=A0A2U1Q2B3_ARTAN|nr:armadillo-type fold protein [Artemisia annua]